MHPPEKATTARIGLVGQACAHASPLAKARPRTDSNMKQIRVMPFSLVSRRALRGRSATRQQPLCFRSKDSTLGPAGDCCAAGFQSGLDRFGSLAPNRLARDAGGMSALLRKRPFAIRLKSVAKCP